MIVEYRTVRDAAEAWVREMNAIPQGMIEKLMGLNPDDWIEITKPTAGDTVYVYDLPDDVDSLEHRGNIRSYNEESDLYCIDLADGNLVSAEESDFEVERDGVLPMWGTMWSFGDSIDDYWIEKRDGLQKMSDCGFRIYQSDEFGYFFGIDGAGYDFYESHWEPLYKARGLQWHDPMAEEERQMLRKGYAKRLLGNKFVWCDKSGAAVKEVGFSVQNQG